jgi:hypothetical protein
MNDSEEIVIFIYCVFCAFRIAQFTEIIIKNFMVESSWQNDDYNQVSITKKLIKSL